VTKVLVVDDDDGIRETVRLALEDAGYSVEEARDGLAALRALHASTEPLVVLLDLMMPTLDGAGVLGSVSGNEQLARRNAYVLVTASHATQTLSFARLLTSLSVGVLYKPFEIDEMLHVVGESARRLNLA